MNKKIMVLTVITLFSTTAIADSGYLCIADYVSGFHFDSDRDTWQHATFLPGQRFLINERRQDIYEVQKMDEQNSWWAICTTRTDQSDDSFSCTNGTNQFHFNREQLRFTSFRYFGYWNGSTDSVSISIGTCFPN